MVMSTSRSALVTMAALGAAVLLYEVLLTRLLAVALFAHLAFAVIAIALSGMTIGGWLASRDSDRPPEVRDGRVSRALLVGAVAALAASAFICWFPMVPEEVTRAGRVVSSFSTRRSAIGGDPWQLHWSVIFFSTLLVSVPFAAASYAQATLFELRAAEAGRLYAFDVVAACLGAFVALLALPLFGGANAIGLVVLLFAAASQATRPPVGPGDWSRARWVLGAAGSLLLLLQPLQMTWAAGFNEGRVVDSRWTPLARVSLYLAGTPDAKSPHPYRRLGDPWLLVDNTSRTRIAFADDTRFRRNLDRVPLGLRPASDVLIIGAGGGQEVDDALATTTAGVVRRIDAVEVAPGMDQMVRKHYSAEALPLERPGVSWHVADGRAFVQWIDQTWGVIQLKEVNLHSLAGQISSGWSPSLLFTEQAFRTYLEHLDGNGLLSVVKYTSGSGNAPTQQLVSTLRAAADSLGLDLTDRVVIVKRRYASGRRQMLLVSKAPLSISDLDALERLTHDARLSIRRSPRKASTDPIIEDLISGDAQATRDRVFRTSGRLLDAVQDDRPFGNQQLTFGDAVLGAPRDADSVEVAVQRMSFKLMAAGVSALLLILGGVVFLFARRSPPGARGRALRQFAVFGGLGVAFMLYEVVLVEQVGLVLGHPTLGLTGVLAALLLALGAGSALSDRFAPESSPQLAASLPALVIAVVAGMPVLVPLTSPWLSTLPIAGRTALLCTSLAVASAPLGFLLPSAIRSLAPGRDISVSACWAVNGAASVLGTVLAALLVRTVGFSASAAAAAIIYAVTGLGWWRMVRAVRTT